jgi:hypothetical protein
MKIYADIEKSNCMNYTRAINGISCPFQTKNDGEFCQYYHDVSNWV